ncbi:hypothetical protein QFZ58_002377 [Streptomyces sp. B1I3]|nr:hypothetical protein [Streptomyces sp. B1I3]
MAGDADAPAHALVTGVTWDGALPSALDGHTVFENRVQGRQFQAMVRPHGPLPGDWQVAEPSLEEVLLAHLRSPEAPALFTPGARIDAEGTQAA